MANTPCTIRNITLIEVTNGVRYTGRVDREGMQIEPDQGVADFSDDVRMYFCSNCMRNFNGEETFDEVKAHLGTFPLDD
jgi:hypothetical protein